MRFSIVLIASLFYLSSPVWETDFENAQTKAKQEHKFILLSFSGSDWCGPCIRLHKEIFDDAAFEKFATDNLVLVNADFPRMKKNQLSKEQQKKNDKLADKYNEQGTFPLTLLLDTKGKVIKSWEGFPDLSVSQFVDELNNQVHAAN